MARMVSYCVCACHNHERGTQRAAQQMGRYMKGFAHADAANQWDMMGCVETESALAAALACAACRNTHCPALSSRPSHEPRLIRLRPFDPASDSQQNNPQADVDKGDETGG